MSMTYTKPSKGFTLLIAALVASITLVIGMGIFRLALRQIALSSIGRDSQYAFYAADAAGECALYWDVRFDTFPTTTPAAASFSCGGVPVTSSASKVGFVTTSTYRYENDARCVDVSVEKTQNQITGEITTTVTADGFNVDCSVVSSGPSARILQRSVQLRY
jgi:Tfp pilus assembly protein PilX